MVFGGGLKIFLVNYGFARRTDKKGKKDKRVSLINIQKHGRGTRPPCFENFP